MNEMSEKNRYENSKIDPEQVVQFTKRQSHNYRVIVYVILKARVMLVAIFASPLGQLDAEEVGHIQIEPLNNTVLF